MRVISGLRKGHRLKAPKGIDVRPTEDKIKESLFNILGNINRDAVVLDLFGGSGSIGIEFLSRGAKECYFVDISDKSIDSIKENLSHTKLLEFATVIRSDAKRAIINFYNKGLKFDYIYLDPPFRREGLLLDILDTIDKYPILKNHGSLVVEHEKELVLEEVILNFKKIDDRRYGSKTIAFFNVIS